jgi:hypothetical protein
VTGRATERRWAATLAGGVVVLVAVTGLLEALRRSVLEVDRRVDALWNSGQRLAGVTQAAHLLGETGRRSGQLRAALDGGTRTGDRL